MAESNLTPEQKLARAKEFMQLLPLTIEIAGLPTSSLDHLYTPDQMEARLLGIKSAYKLARAYYREVTDGQ